MHPDVSAAFAGQTKAFPGTVWTGTGRQRWLRLGTIVVVIDTTALPGTANEAASGDRNETCCQVIFEKLRRKPSAFRRKSTFRRDEFSRRRGRFANRSRRSSVPSSTLQTRRGREKPTSHQVRLHCLADGTICKSSLSASRSRKTPKSAMCAGR